MKKYDNLPENLKNKTVKYYFYIINKRKVSLYIKTIFDFIVSLVFLIILFPLFLIIAILIKLDSKGPIFFKQNRVTKYGEIFKIFKFRTMVNNAEDLGSQVTIENDIRITRIGKLLRKVRLDETPQVINILLGDMSFVGTRPEVIKYVNEYTDDMKATLLMKAGVTSLASINFKDEDSILKNADNIDDFYIKKILPQKMKYNLEYIEKFNFLHDIKLMIKTFWNVIKK